MAILSSDNYSFSQAFLLSYILFKELRSDISGIYSYTPPIFFEPGEFGLAFSLFSIDSVILFSFIETFYNFILFYRKYRIIIKMIENINTMQTMIKISIKYYY